MAKLGVSLAELQFLPTLSALRLCVDSITTFFTGKCYLKKNKQSIYIIEIWARVYISGNINLFPFLGSKRKQTCSFWCEFNTIYD